MTIAIVGVLVGGLYAAGWWYWARRLAWEFDRDKRRRWSLIYDESMRREAIASGLFVAMAWPIVVLIHYLMMSADEFMLPPRRERNREREESMQRRIDDLEREMGIR